LRIGASLIREEFSRVARAIGPLKTDDKAMAIRSKTLPNTRNNAATNCQFKKSAEKCR